jgi:magnesium chelatase family protein
MYWSKLSGPLMDRIDLQVAVNRLKPEEMTSQGQGESSEPVRQRVAKARAMAIARFSKDSKISCNAEMQAGQLRQFCQLDQNCRQLLEGAIKKLGLSARAMDRILKVSRTIADLGQSENIQTGHLAEAIQYRTLDRFT